MPGENDRNDALDNDLNDAIDSGLVEEAALEPQESAGQEQPQQTGQPDPSEREADGKQPTPDDEPKSALDAVRRALDAQREESAREVAARKETAPKQGDDAEEKEGKDGKDEKPDDKSDILTEEEYRRLPPRVRKRLGRLAAEAKAERTARESLEPRARAFDQMEEFVRASGMSQEQFDNGLRIMAWTISDPAKAFEALKPIYSELQAHVGERLPQDLQEQVDDGRITPELASQLAFERSQRTLLETQAAQQRQATEQHQLMQRQQQEFEQHREAFTRAINAWDATQKQSDPDYARKQQLIVDRATIMVQNEQPQDIESLIALMNRAKKMVDRQIPASRRQINPVNATGAPGQARPVPKSALEAVTLGLEAGGPGR